MPVHAATKGGRPGWRWGDHGTVYTYPPGDDAASGKAKQRAFLQGYTATHGGGAKEGSMADLSGKAWRKPALADFTDKPWEQLSRAERRGIASHFAWAPTDAATFGDLKLPFKDPGGSVNHNAVANALARLGQTQGIPAAAKAKIRVRLEQLMRGAKKDFGMGDVHVPTAIGTSLAQRRGRRKAAVEQLEAAPLAALAELLPAEVVLAAGFVAADAADLRKDADLALILAAPYTGQHFMLRGAPTWLALRKAAEAGGMTVRFRRRAAAPVALYDLVLKRAPPPDARPDPDEEDEAPNDEAVEHEGENGMTGFRILAKSAAQQKVTGVVLESNAVDTQNDFVGPEEIEQACHQFGADYRARKTHLGYNHRRMLTDDEAVLVENYCLPAPATIGGQALPAGTWCQVWKIGSPDLWREVESGAIAGFSFGGSGLRRRANRPAALPK